MRQKLTIVVTCTDRKSAAPTPDLRVRNLPTGQLPSRARLWTKAPRRRRRRQARSVELYRGEAWTPGHAPRGCGARRPGSSRHCSSPRPALGCGRIDDSAPAYAATFSARPRRLGRPSLADEHERGGGLLPGLSVCRAYGTSACCWCCLRATRERGRDDLLEQLAAAMNCSSFGGSREVARLRSRLPQTERLRSALGRDRDQPQPAHGASHGWSACSGDRLVQPTTRSARGRPGPISVRHRESLRPRAADRRPSPGVRRRRCGHATQASPRPALCESCATQGWLASRGASANSFEQASGDRMTARMAGAPGPQGPAERRDTAVPVHPGRRGGRPGRRRGADRPRRGRQAHRLPAPREAKHVKQIQDYLDSRDVLFPNGLILALPPEVKFKSSRGPGHQ